MGFFERFFGSGTDRRVARLYDEAGASAEKGDFDRALTLLRQALPLRPDSGWANKRQIQQVLQGENIIVREDLEKAIARVLLDRAFTELKRQNWRQAVATLTEAIDFNPSLIQAYHRRAIAYLALNELDRAFTDCDRVIKSDPTPITGTETPPYVADAHAHRGAVFARKGQHDKAIADFTKAIQLAPNVAIPYEWRAQSHRAVGDTSSAAEDERRARELAG
jgi:tetratricopeptide (TPR) repeat protein